MTRRNKKSSPTRIIEASQNEPEKSRERERAFIKYPGEEPTQINKELKRGSASLDREKINKIYQQHGNREYRLIHTHPYSEEQHFSSSDFPNFKVFSGDPTAAPNDFYSFMLDNGAKSTAIAQYNTDNGKVEGYFILRKTKRTPLIVVSEDTSRFSIFERVKRWILEKRLQNYSKKIDKAKIEDDSSILIESMANVADRYHLQYRWVPVKGYKRRLNESRFDKDEELEGIVSSSMAVVGILTGLFFLSSNLAGNVIGSLNQTSSNWIGGVLFIIGLVGAFAYFRRRK